jgi:hypothetical protein
MITVRAADVEAKSIEWLGEQRIPLGKITLVAGEPGLAKSQLVAHLAATVSRGALWAVSDHCAPKGSVVIVSTEDDISDTIVPRLQAAERTSTRSTSSTG